MASMWSGLVCRDRTKAASMYLRRAAAVMCFYMATVFAVTRMVRAHHFAGPKLYLLAVLPAVPILALLVVVGLYLRDETDEFKRWQAVQSMLWATGITLAVTTVGDFLKSFGAIEALPEFTVFLTFWLSMAVVQLVMKMRSGAGGDD